MSSEQKTYKQKLDSFVSGLENKLTDVVILAAWAVMEKNARQDKKCKGLKRSASSKCCAYCMSHEGTYTSEQVDAGAMGGRHEACKCKVTPVFEYLNPAIRKEMDACGIRDNKLKFIAESQTFKTKLDRAKAVNYYGGYVDTYDVATLDKFKKFLSEDGMCGVAIKPDGDITAVFKNEEAKYKGAVYDLLLTARENGGVKLDCYGKDLVGLYEKCGFEPVARVKFDPQYVDDKVLLEKKPDIFFMKRTDKDTLQVVKDYGSKAYKQTSLKELMNLPVFDYEKAAKYRDNMLK